MKATLCDLCRTKCEPGIWTPAKVDFNLAGKTLKLEFDLRHAAYPDPDICASCAIKLLVDELVKQHNIATGGVAVTSIPPEIEQAVPTTQN